MRRDKSVTPRTIRLAPFDICFRPREGIILGTPAYIAPNKHEGSVEGGRNPELGRQELQRNETIEARAFDSAAQCTA